MFTSGASLWSNPLRPSSSFVNYSPLTSKPEAIVSISNAIANILSLRADA